AEALTALLSKYLEAAIAVEQSELEIFFGNFVARSKVRDAVNALLAARELSFTQVAGRSMLQITTARVAFDPAAQVVARQAARQERQERQERLQSSAAAPRARRPFNKFSPGPRDANSRGGKPSGPKRRQP
ncbi:MAG: hypothetical protein WAN60_05870, partial [Candidatus Sulfotelmatobacter sp.]